MFENIMNFFKKLSKKEKNKDSSNAAKERLHLVLMQDRANVSADFLELMRQEIIEVIKKYIHIEEESIDVKLTNKMNEDGTVGAPALYANIPIVTIKNEAKKIEEETQKNQNENKKEEVMDTKKDSVIKNEQEEKSSKIEEQEKKQEREQEHTEKQSNEEKAEVNS